MVTIDDVDEVLIINFGCLIMDRYRYERRHMGRIMEYDIYKSGKIFGKVRLRRGLEGRIICGPIQGPSDKEDEKEWDWICNNLVYPAVRQAEEKIYSSQPSPNRGPNVRTQIRFEEFQRIKREHPEWSQTKVAQVASKSLNENVSSDTVRNTYRQMGVPWERADRVR